MTRDPNYESESDYTFPDDFHDADSDDELSDTPLHPVQSVNWANPDGYAHNDPLQSPLSYIRLRDNSVQTMEPTRPRIDAADTERQFLRRVLANTRKPARTQEGYFELYLDDFKIFNTGNPRKAEPLHLLASPNSKKTPQLSVSGRIRFEGGITEYIEALKITGVYIRNFGRLDSHHRPTTSTCRNATYLETQLSNNYDCRYLLRSPKSSYKDVFSTFIWLATFSKHVHDYIHWSMKNERSVNLNDFRVSFHQKLSEWHHQDSDFLEWSQRCSGTKDFRQQVACGHHAHFIYDQICCIKQSDNGVLLSQPLWKEIAPKKLRPPTKEKTHLQRPTPVTPWLKEAWLNAFPHWRRRQERDEDLIVALDLAPDVLRKRNERSLQIGLGDKLSHRLPSHFNEHNVSIAALFLEKASGSNTNTLLRIPGDQLLGKAVILRMENEKKAEYKYAYVHKVCNEGRRLAVRWLVLPSQTVCEGRTAGRPQTRPKTFYPIGNELFFSDECCCGTVAAYKVAAIYSISILHDHALPEHDLFVHRQYISQDHAMCEMLPEKIRSCAEHEWREGYSRRKHVISRNIRQYDTIGSTSSSSILSLFSGAGLLDRGFEHGAAGKFKTRFAADFNLAALTSHKLNQPHSEHCQFHNADINILWEEIAQGRRPCEDIVILISGCPCQGFTGLNNNKEEDEARKNCSMLAQTMAWIDVFRPLMVLVENVTQMDPLGSGSKQASAAGQAVSSLVSIGYQTRLVTIRDSDHGGATIRKRLFIFATAPGIPLPQIPRPSHGSEKDQSALVTASLVTRDLMKIHNTTYINPSQPDHVPFLNLGGVEHDIVAKIPTVSSDSRNNLYAARSKIDTPAEAEWFGRLREDRKIASSHSYSRMKPNSPMQTLVTSFNLMCSRTGNLLHWLDHRACSLLELRRGHGVPDDYILVGDRAQQLHHIGNSVAWVTAELLGRVFAEA